MNATRLRRNATRPFQFRSGKRKGKDKVRNVILGNDEQL